MSGRVNRFGGALLLGALAVALAAAAPALERLAVAKSKLVDPIWAEHDPSSEAVLDHSAWSAFLNAYVRTDDEGVARVAYADVTDRDRTALAAYLRMLQTLDPTQLNRNEQLAYWTNLYNARTVELILENYPVASIRRIRSGLFSTGPWGRILINVNGRDLSLNDVESGIVRPIWNEPRIHYIFNCAAVGCPNLGLEAYEGARIDEQMTEAARSYVNSARGAFERQPGEIVVSKVYSWYRVDFGGDKAGILDELRRHAEGDLAETLAGDPKIDGYAYDWALNDAAVGVFTDGASSP